MNDVFVLMIMGGVTGLGLGFITGLAWGVFVVNNLTGGKNGGKR